MCLDVGGVDGNLVGRPRQRRRQFSEHVLPDSLLRPAVIAIVDRRRGTVLHRAILPAAARLKNMDDAADDPPIIDPPPPRRSVRQVRFDQLPLFVGKPETIPHDPKPPLLGSRLLNQIKLMSSDSSFSRLSLHNSWVIGRHFHSVG